MKDLLELVVLTRAASWLLLIGTLAAIVFMPKLFGFRIFNGLLYAQMTLAFNAVTIIAGLDAQLISAWRALHFYAVELGFFAASLAVYRHILTHRTRVLSAINTFFAGRGVLALILAMTLMSIFNFMMVPNEDESRIAYMTASWFSLVRPFFTLATPLAYVGVFILLRNSDRRYLGFLLLITTIAANVLTGSKASFVFNLLTAFFALRDISGHVPFRLQLSDKWKLLLLVGAMVAFTLNRLEVTVADVADRFLLFGEATILTYFSDSPTDACADVSTLASMHRGLARLIGDSSANDIDTLFGFALSKLYLGTNTFTGPNGRLSAYFLCNFPGIQVGFGCLVIATYLSLITWLCRRSVRRHFHLVFVFPFIVTSLTQASQDFNLIMSDMTVMVILLMTSIPSYASYKRVLYG